MIATSSHHFTQLWPAYSQLVLEKGGEQEQLSELRWQCVLRHNTHFWNTLGTGRLLPGKMHCTQLAYTQKLQCFWEALAPLSLRCPAAHVLGACPVVEEEKVQTKIPPKQSAMWHLIAQTLLTLSLFHFLGSPQRAEPMGSKTRENQKPSPELQRNKSLKGVLSWFTVMQQAAQPRRRLSMLAPGPVRNRTVYGWDSLYQDGAQNACVVFPDFPHHG